VIEGTPGRLDPATLFRIQAGTAFCYMTAQNSCEEFFVYTDANRDSYLFLGPGQRWRARGSWSTKGSNSEPFLGYASAYNSVQSRGCGHSQSVPICTKWGFFGRLTTFLIRGEKSDNAAKDAEASGGPSDRNLYGDFRSCR
jgi:hypothetical protein